MTTDNNHATTITVPSAAPTVTDLDALDIEFHEGDQATRPITEEARLWWFNGLPTDTDTMAIGWHVRADVNPSIDETMQGMGIQRYMIQHKKPDKDGVVRPKPYWRLRTCSLIVVAHRLQSALEMNKAPADRLGIAFGWETVRDEHGHPVMNRRGKAKKQTVLKLHAFVHEMVRHGYAEWLPLTLSGYSTDSLLDALAEQYRVLDAYSAYRRAQNKNSFAPFYLFSLPLAPGQVKMVGEPPDQGTIYPMIAQVPATIDTTYLAQHLVPKELVTRIRAALLDEAILWSMEESVRIAQGREEGNEPLSSHEMVQSRAASVPQLPAGTPSESDQDPPVQQPQLAWIVRQYCREDRATLEAVCRHFGVQQAEQLRVSHFRELVQQKQQAQRQ